MNDAPDLKAVTQIQQGIWSKGDFAMVAALVYPAAEGLADGLEIIPDERVLDVACGSGNAAIAAARRSWGGVVGADYVPALLERGRERAAAERLGVEFVEADAQALPFDDASFDVTMSIFGAMFAPDQPQEGAVGTMFQTIAKHAPPPPGVESPLRWGTEERVRELFGDGVTDIRFERRISRQPFRSAEHYVEFFRKYFGPTQMAYERVGPEGEQALTEDFLAFLNDANTAGDRAMVLEAEYLQLVATRA
jgi:SAM-dependent methyltransferase